MINSNDPYAPQTPSINLSPDTLIVEGEHAYTINRSGGRFQYDGTPPEVHTGSTIQRAVSETGSPRTGSDIDENSVVSITGIPMKIKDAMRAGLIERTQDGGFEVAHQGSKSAQQSTTKAMENNDDGGMEALPPHIEDSITQVAQRASQGDVLNVINSVAQDGKANEHAINRIASQLGLEPEEAHNRYEEIRSSMETQARRAVVNSGADPDDVFNWAWANKPELMQQAIKTQATERTTKGYKQITKEYLANNTPYSPDDIVNAQFPEGVSARKLPNGEVALNIRGLEVGFKDAVRRGMLNISRQ